MNNPLPGWNTEGVALLRAVRRFSRAVWDHITFDFRFLPLAAPPHCWVGKDHPSDRTMEARKGRVNCGSMSGRCRQPSSGATSLRPISSSSTCGGESTCTCNARHRATRTAVLSGVAEQSLCMRCSRRLIAGLLRRPQWRFHRELPPVRAGFAAFSAQADTIKILTKSHFDFLNMLEFRPRLLNIRNAREALQQCLCVFFSRLVLSCTSD